jgi:site-specific DNA recombinase
MMKRIAHGEAAGIIAWHPDRLARNSIDGGRIVYDLDNGRLKDLRFGTFAFENDPQGKFMLSIAFGYSKYYSDALSVNVKRGLRAKAQKGGYSGVAPIGYLNTADATISPDPERFPLVRKLWEAMLTGKLSVREVWQLSQELGLTTVLRKRTGGKVLSLSALYHVFKNPLYAGIVTYEGRSYPGTHVAMVEMDEFEKVQGRLTRADAPRPKAKSFPFAGMFRCGECGFAVTAEDKINRYGSRYTYYHCSKRRPDYDCRQRSVTAATLEKQLRDFVATVSVGAEAHAWALRHLGRRADSQADVEKARRAALERSLAANRLAMRNLLQLRIKSQINDEQFSEARQELEREEIGLNRKLAAASSDNRFEPEVLFTEFCFRALFWFDQGDDRLRREIAEIVGSNPVLLNRQATLDMAIPFRRQLETSDISFLRGAVHDVRTFSEEPEVRERMRRLRVLVERHEPEFLAHHCDGHTNVT